jgi:hypothetical protein
MSIFSFNWFKKNKPKDETPAVVITTSTESTAPTLQYVEKYNPLPYSSLKIVNDVITVVLNNGNVISKTDAKMEDYEAIKTCTTEADIIKYVMKSNSVNEPVYVEHVVVTVKDIESLTDDFERNMDGSITMKETGRSVPALLVSKFSSIISKYDTPEEAKNDEEYIALKRFFMWCCLNPRAEVANSLYDFLQKNGMRITKQGFFVALRNVVRVPGIDTEFTEFVCNAYNKVKAVWKKKPVNFFVTEIDGVYTIVKSNYPKGSVIGNLDSLYTSLPDQEGNRFTDNWTKTFDIRIGKVVSMPSKDCNWSTQDCATAGLHFAGHTAPYVLCGDTTVFTLHNPMKVVGIGKEKGRCYEYLPFMTTTVDEADEIMKSGEFDFLQLDEQYAINELDYLVERVKEGFATEATKHTFNISSMSNITLSNIVASLEKMKHELKSRVEVIK